MKRILACGLGLFGGLATAADVWSTFPASTKPVAASWQGVPQPLTAPSPQSALPPVAVPAAPTVVRTAGTTADVTRPLSAVVAEASAAAPVGYQAGDCLTACSTGECRPDCGTPLFPMHGPRYRTGAGMGVERPTLVRIKEWLTWQPGPRCLPFITPEPYRAPLRTYFPGACRTGGCATAAAPAAVPCATCGPVSQRSTMSRVVNFLVPGYYAHRSDQFDEPPMTGTTKGSTITVPPYGANFRPSTATSASLPGYHFAGDVQPASYQGVIRK